MEISSGSPSGTATAVWASATRTLTSLGAGAMLTFAQANQSLAASATVNLGPAAGRLRFANIGIKAGAAGTAQIVILDGSNTYVMVTVTAASTGGILDSVLTNANSVYIKNNDATNPAIWSGNGGDFIT